MSVSGAAAAHASGHRGQAQGGDKTRRHDKVQAPKMVQGASRIEGDEPSGSPRVGRRTCQLRRGSRAKEKQREAREGARMTRPLRGGDAGWMLRSPAEQRALVLVARPAGVEPTTPGFGGQYSIQLSYGRVPKTLIVAGEFAILRHRSNVVQVAQNRGAYSAP